MINHKIVQLSIYVGMSYLITKLSFYLLMKEFFKIGEHLAKLLTRV